MKEILSITENGGLRGRGTWGGVGSYGGFFRQVVWAVRLSVLTFINEIKTGTN